MPIKSGNRLKFNTAIITYPSDYDGLLTIELILKNYSTLMTPTTKVVVAQEDPDEEIQRKHYHLYWDDEKAKSVTTNYFNIDLPEPVVVFINPDEKKTRSYQLLSELQSQLGIDSNLDNDMVPLLDQYVKENYKEGTEYDILKVAHPNIQLKKDYGDKYFMLRYVVKQKLIARANFDVNKELEYLEENFEELLNRTEELIEQDLMQQLNLETVDELIYLLKKYKEKLLKRQEKRLNGKKKRGRKPKGGSELDDDSIMERLNEFRDWLRKLVLQNKLTKKEVLKEILENKDYWSFYCGSYLNYNKLIGDMFRGKPPSKPVQHYEYTFWVPNKLYDYLMWLDQWVENWHTGKPLEHRPKGLCLIGPSRIGKTALLSCLGDFSYFKNMWNIDCWEGKAAFTVMDDMDAGDEGKGLSFCWYKPFFGAQDAITVTDKYKPKEDIYNGKPLIWLNNFDIEDTFKSSKAQDYISKNMEIIYIQKPFKEPPVGMEIYQYKEFDPKNTWYYKNVYLKNKKEEDEEESDDTFENKQTISRESTHEEKSKQTKPIDDNDNHEINNDDELEPLSKRKQRINLLENEKGRPSKRIRRKD